jgi:hypothetical protein
LDLHVKFNLLGSNLVKRGEIGYHDMLIN